MNHYFTISKFARLRGIDINSLRYYERLGILTPAYTDPHTRYRYYTAEQLSLLDMILLCINLGVPLKELKAYFDESGRFQNRALFEEGKRRTQEKMSCRAACAALSIRSPFWKTRPATHRKTRRTAA